MTGFVDGEGCFYVKLIQHSKTPRVSVNFSIYQNVRDLDLLYAIKTYLNCGIIEVVTSRPNAAKYVVYIFEDIINKIIPFLDKYNLQGIKRLDYNDFRKVAIILSQSKNNLDDKSFNSIKLIKAKMNKNRTMRIL